MGLTRPTAAQIDSSSEVITDPISLLNNKSTQANVDVGFLFNRDGGISSNVAVFWQESNQQFVFALTSSDGVSRFSNIAVTSNANVVTGNVFAAGYFYSNGTAFTGGAGSSYSNVQVATYLPTYSGNIANIRLGIAGVLTFADGTTQTTAGGGGGSNYGNANVTAYTVSMGFTNFSNVNVKAYSESMGYQNYGNVNVAALITTNGLTNYSNANVQSFVTTNGLTNYSNVNTAAYLASQSITSYSNVQVATFLPTYSGVLGSSNLQVTGGGTFSGTLTIGASGFINSGGNILATGLSVFGNARVGLAGAVSGQFHTVVGNITQTSSGGAVYINTTGNISAAIINTSALNATGTTTAVAINSTGFINTTANISAAVVNAGALNATGNLTASQVAASNGIFVNNMTIAANYTIPTGYGASSVGAVTINSGVVVTVPSGSRWVVL